MLNWMSTPFRGFTLSLCFSVLATTVAVGEPVDPSRFEKSTIASNLVQPMELDIAPDGRIFLIELAGVLKRIDPKSGDVDVVGKLEVTTAQENGLIGLALDPKFAENNWVYLQYSPPDFPGQRISRFTIVDDQLDLQSEKRLFSYEEQRRECCHHAGSLEFGPDGNLYIGTGDNTNPFNDSQGYAPLDERADREPWDAQRTAGNTKSYNGKVLRIHPETDGTYTIPDGNLFPKDGSIGHPEIYVMGCRNPWRISIDPQTGYLYWGDVGPDAGQDGDRGPRGYDEVNQARVAGNFGWPYFIGNNQAYSIVDFVTGTVGASQDPADPINDSVNNTGAKKLPPANPAMIYYPAATSEIFPEVGSGGRTACAGPVYYFDESNPSTTKFPAAYDRTLFAYEWSRHWIIAVHLDQDSNVQQLERFMPDTTFVRPIDLQFDASGALYVIEYGETWGVNPDARLVRIDYVRGNRAPVAAASVQNSVGREPLETHFSAEGSFDKDGDPLSYRWTATRSSASESNVGQSDQRELIGTQARFTHRFADAGVYTIELEVRDSADAARVTSLPVIVGNSRPEVEFLRPHDGDFFTPGQPVGFSLVVRDHEDGTSDFDEAEERSIDPIDSAAATRLFVEAVPVVSGEDAAAENVPAGLALIRKSDCLNCHAANRLLVGPAFVEIAKKYKDQPHQLELSIKRVIEGSTGVWGKVAMLPHSQHTPSEVQQMVEYVFSVSPDSANPSAQGFNNSLIPAGNTGQIRLEATYTDRGRDDIPKLSATGVVTLRSRQLQAESAAEIKGARPLGSSKAEGGKFVGAIEHDGFLRFDNVPLDQVGSITVRVASAGAGGDIEIRRGSVTGDLLGGTPVEVNGDWEAFYEKTIALTESDARDVLYVVFKNAEKRGGLMNLDSLRFEPRR